MAALSHSLQGLAATSTTTIHTAADITLGQVAFDASGNKYIFLKGVASTAAGDLVTYDEAYVTTRLLSSGSSGPVAVAMAATVASTWGWYQIAGSASVNGASDITDSNGDVYASATAGRAAAATDTTKPIVGIVARGAAASNLFTAQLDHPFFMPKPFQQGFVTYTMSGATIHAGAGGVVPAWTVPADCIITDAFLNITTGSSGASTIDIGYTSSSSTTSVDNMFDGIDAAVIARSVMSDTALDAGANVGSKAAAATKWVTIDEKTGDVTGLVGTLTIFFRLVA